MFHRNKFVPDSSDLPVAANNSRYVLRLRMSLARLLNDHQPHVAQAFRLDEYQIARTETAFDGVSFLFTHCAMNVPWVESMFAGQQTANGCTEN